MAESEVEKAAAEAYPDDAPWGGVKTQVHPLGALREAYLRGRADEASRLSPPTREELEAALADIAIPLDGDTKSWLNPHERQVIAAALAERWPSLSAPETKEQQ